MFNDKSEQRLQIPTFSDGSHAGKQIRFCVATNFPNAWVNLPVLSNPAWEYSMFVLRILTITNQKEALVREIPHTPLPSLSLVGIYFVSNSNPVTP